MSKIIFIPAGPITWASSRYRAFWVAEQLGADCLTVDEITKRGVDLLQYSAVVWQKTADIAAMTAVHEAGIPQWLDACDPIHWFTPEDFRRIIPLCTGVVTPTAALARDIQEFINVPTVVIPDRLRLSEYPIRRIHIDTPAPRLIWFGLFANRPSLFGALPTLERLSQNGYRFELTIMDERPDVRAGVSDAYQVYQAKWDLWHENATIAAHDIALLPPYPGPWGEMKSNNKQLTAWACGLPVVSGYDYHKLEMLLSSHTLRQEWANIDRKTLQQHGIEKSAEQWREVLNV